MNNIPVPVVMQKFFEPYDDHDPLVEGQECLDAEVIDESSGNASSDASASAGADEDWVASDACIQVGTACRIFREKH